MKVSVITTCFNAEKVIEKTIKSVLTQEYADFEYIIQDGGSTDNTKEVCLSFQDAFKERNIPFYFYSEKDSGIYDGMNKAVLQANGEYINFMNADDYFYDENVLTTIFTEKLNQNNNITNVIITGVINDKTADPDIIYGDAVEYECGNYYKYNKCYDRITKAMPFSHQSVFAKRDLLIKYPFDTSLSIGADYDFLLTAYTNNAIFFDCERFVCVVSRDGKSSRDLYNTFIETVKIQRNHGINNFTDSQYKKKLRSMRFKQFIMDLLPEYFIEKIRLMQRKSRGQDETVEDFHPLS